MDQGTIARALILGGVLLAVLGVFMAYGPGLSWLSWLGRLPGDIRIERDGFRLYVPVVTCLVISVALTLLFYLLSRLR